MLVDAVVVCLFQGFFIPKDSDAKIESDDGSSTA